MISYSQAGQDLFVHNLTKGNKGTFLDLGCFLPKKINNTYLLELNGWDGISLDIQDLNKEWEERRCKFVQANCLTTDYNNLLSEHYNDKTIDYLTLDMEGCGDRYKLLSKIIESDYNFKIITIEHDAYLGDSFVNQEKIPQRELLTSKGYKLICADISQKDHPTLFFEDWWVNPQYFEESELEKWVAEKTSCDKIFEKLNIEYEMSDESKPK